MSHATIQKQIEASPFPSTVDKYWEAWYFLLGVCENYHDPIAFKYELNAFIQSLRNITFMLQSEPRRPTTFAAWYTGEQAKLRGDATLRRFVEVRNLVVKQSSLVTKSKVDLGLFRGRRFKLGFSSEISPLLDSTYLISHAQKFMVGFMLDEAHSQVGEQVGVKRVWIAPEIGESEVVGHCAEALATLGGLVRRAHAHCDTTFDPDFLLPAMDTVAVKLESDLDPTLPKKWGWV
jgi:hypothetical protein